MPRQRRRSEAVPAKSRDGCGSFPPEPAPAVARQVTHCPTDQQLVEPIILPWDSDSICFVVHNIISAKEANNLRGWLERCGNWELEAGDVGHLRSSFRVVWEDPVLTETLWKQLKECLPAELCEGSVTGLNHRLRFMKYNPGHFFAPHQDNSSVHSSCKDRCKEQSYLTALLYLSDLDEFCDGDGDGGGRTRFISPNCSVAMRGCGCNLLCDHCVDAKVRKGSVLIFSHELMHAGTLLRSGDKLVMRTDVMYSNPQLASRPQQSGGRRASHRSNRRVR